MSGRARVGGGLRSPLLFASVSSLALPKYLGYPGSLRRALSSASVVLGLGVVRVPMAR